MDFAQLLLKIMPIRDRLVHPKRTLEHLLGKRRSLSDPMKREKNLFPKLISDENLKKAIITVINSHRWVRYPDVPNRTAKWLEDTLDKRVAELKKIIIEGYVPNEVTRKKRYDRNARKWRDICEPKMFPDQCVHHALVQVVEPIMMHGMDKWCCGSIKGRGAHYGVKAIKKWINEDKSGTRYCIEADIYHFYDSLKPDMVIARMKCLIKDHNVLDLMERILTDGVQIGAYCSQWFANTFLQPLDHAIRENFKVAHYVRYMDNFTIFCNRKREAKKLLQFIQDWLADHGLKLKGNWQIFRTNKRLPNALGYRFGKGYTLLRKQSLLTLKRQLKSYYRIRERGNKVSIKFAQALISRLGMLRHCNSYNIYHRFIRKHTLRNLKVVVRTWQNNVLVAA